MRTHLLSALVVVLMASVGYAEEGEPEDRAATPLVEAVQASPINLWQAVSTSQSRKRKVLRANFALSTKGQLLLQMLLKAAPDDGGEFVEWLGPVTDQCWLPRDRVLTTEAEIAQARGLLALVRSKKRTLAEAVETSRGLKRADPTQPMLALSVEPFQEGGDVRVASLVAIEGTLHRVTQQLASGLVLSTEPASAPQPIAASRVNRDWAVPDLRVPGGIWFYAETAPTLARFKGGPLLVAVADPG